MPRKAYATPRARSSGLRRLLKRGALGLAWVGVCPLVGLDWLERRAVGEDALRTFTAAKELLAFSPGVVGSYLRLAFYRAVCRDVSGDASFGIGSMLSRRDVAIGPGTVVGAHSIIGRAEVGAQVLIAARVSVFSDRYLHGQPGDRARGEDAGLASELVRVGDGCWIGENAVVMASLGPRCTVAAGSVVLRPAEAGSTLMGNPARRVNL